MLREKAVFSAVFSGDNYQIANKLLMAKCASKMMRCTEVFFRENCFAHAYAEGKGKKKKLGKF